MFRHYNFQRIISSVILVTFSSLTLYPCAVSAQVRAAAEQANNPLQTRSDVSLNRISAKLPPLASSANTAVAIKRNNSEERLSQLLKQIQDEVKAVAPAVANAPAKTGLLALAAKTSSNTDLVNQHVSTIRTANSQIKSLYSDIDQSFKDTEQHIKDAKLSSEILSRHSKAVAQYQSRQAEFDKIMDRVAQADDKRQASDRQAALSDLGSFMDKYPNAKPHQYTDPNKLPFGSPSNKVRKPNESKAQYQATLFPPKYEKILLAGPIPDGLKLTQATLPTIPTAQDTAETEDVQLTSAIKAQAAALNNNPVQIYNWVRNNISFIPSYGSIQGSDLTLQNKRGNAFDTASLLIALYRSAGIPATYVYGTIDVSADRVMNWVGGATKIEAAQSLLGQGGIPNIGLANGGKISAIRMEHVWVEAFVDYVPSRGAINKNPNTWVPVDASFKQNAFSQGMNINAQVPLDSQTLIAQIQQGATVDIAKGFVQNLNQANLQAQMTSYQVKVKTYIDGQKTNANSDDILGTQTITPESYSILMGSLPYQVVATGNTFQTLPDNLRWKFKTNLYAADGISTGDNAVIELKQSTPKLAGKKITLSFIPATQADQDLINSYLPKAHTDGTPIQPSELPNSLPGYLLNMKAEIRVDGQVVAQTVQSFTMGSSVKQSNQYFNPASGTWVGGDDADITVGEYDAIGLDLQGTTFDMLKKHQEKLSDTSSKLTQYRQNPNDTSSIRNLTKDDLTGDVVQSGILGYFSHVDNNDDVMAKTNSQVINYRAPSYGRFFATASPHFFFGIVRSVSFDGVAMDIKSLVQNAVAKNDDRATRTGYLRQIGSAGSVAEHLIPQFIFGNPQLPPLDSSQPQSVSAIKILGIAGNQGQRIYKLNSSNISLHSEILTSLQIEQDVKSEISNALAAGMEVTVHGKDVILDGWVGSGYIILDPNTGSGVYKIAGGTNGSYMEIANQYRLVYGALAWESIRSDRTQIEEAGGYSEAVRNAEHLLLAYSKVCDEGQSRAQVVLLTYLYFIGKALVWDANSLLNSSVTIPGVGTFDFRGSPLTFDQLAAGLRGAALGGKCAL
ncbi:transglutaminase-like domain-containing protein [Undibacterium sp. Ji49W]|uniref:transglutaminase-like domain-containing protein n=1 Tax=Undibacterium sp. Ji49W TaxID=3413040 RepID=UPI003BF2CBD2